MIGCISNHKNYKNLKTPIINFYAQEGFIDGDKKFIRKTYDIEEVTTKQKITKYSHTPNIDDNGTSNGNYSNSYSKTDVINIPGATELNISIKYQTEDSCDWVCMWEGAYPSYDATNNYETSITGRLMGTTTTTKTYTAPNDTVTIAFRSDSSSTYYGYYAVITADITVLFYVIKQDSIIIPTPTCIGKTFAGWYLDNNKKFDINTYIIKENDYIINLYAKFI